MILYSLTEVKGWTYEEIGELTMAQLRNEANGGKKPAPRLGKKAANRILKEFKAGKWGF